MIVTSLRYQRRCREWLPDNHLPYFISDVVDQLSCLITASYERENRRATVSSTDDGQGAEGY